MPSYVTKWSCCNSIERRSPFKVISRQFRGMAADMSSAEFWRIWEIKSSQLPSTATGTLSRPPTPGWKTWARWEPDPAYRGRWPRQGTRCPTPWPRYWLLLFDKCDLTSRCGPQWLTFYASPLWPDVKWMSFSKRHVPLDVMADNKFFKKIKWDLFSRFQETNTQ